MDNSRKTPRLIPGGLAVDDRGQLTFANEFSFEGVRRFYLVENFSTDTVRAFHGHMREEKYIVAVSGTAVVATVPLDDPVKPSRQSKVDRFVLSARQPRVLHIPAGYANGFRSLESATRLLILSTSTLEESKNDDIRFPYDYWGKEVWEVEFR